MKPPSSCGNYSCRRAFPNTILYSEGKSCLTKQSGSFLLGHHRIIRLRHLSENLRPDFFTFPCNTQSIPSKKCHHQNTDFLEIFSRRIIRCCLRIFFVLVPGFRILLYTSSRARRLRHLRMIEHSVIHVYAKKAHGLPSSI